MDIDDTTCYKKVNKDLWEDGKFVVFSTPGWLDDDHQQAAITFAYQVFTIVMVVMVSLGYFGNQVKHFFLTLIIGYAPESTELAKYPTSPESPYYIQGKEDEFIPASAVDLQGYIPSLADPHLGYPQLAIQIPDKEWEITRPTEVTGNDSWFPRSMVNWHENPNLQNLNIYNEIVPVSYDFNNVYNDKILDGFDKGLLFTICRAYKEIHPAGELPEKLRKSKRSTGKTSVQFNPIV